METYTAEEQRTERSEPREPPATLTPRTAALRPGSRAAERAARFCADTPVKQLLFTTVRLDLELDNGSVGSGTAFLYAHPWQGRRVPFVVTNRHLTAGVRRGGLVFTRRDETGRPLVGSAFLLEIDEFATAWYGHPDAEVDLAILPLRPLLTSAEEQGALLYHTLLDERWLLTEEEETALDALEPLLVVGYPSGVWDGTNLLPVLRRGVTATPLALDFEGRAEFLVDAAIFPGSSGSPVFLADATTGVPYRLAGVIAAVFFREEEVVTRAPAPAVAIAGMVSEMLDLGLALKGERVAEVCAAFCSDYL
ncbi:MAG: serine protease [Hydrogenophilus sp.]|nr:serine protease [Hydrogenophilus sp.]